MAGEVGWLAVGVPDRRPVGLGVEQQQDRGVGEQQRIAELAAGQRARPIPRSARRP